MEPYKFFDNGGSFKFARDDDVCGHRECVVVVDDPAFDATDGAHPAWWRGDDHGAQQVIYIVNEVLDGKKYEGAFGNPDLQALCDRLVALVGEGK